MKFTNFEVSNESPIAIAVVCEGQKYDLHNHGRYNGFVFDNIEHKVTMIWDMFSDYRDEYNTAHLRLEFTNVLYFEISPRDPEMPPNEDETLTTLTFIDADDNLMLYRKTDSWPCFDPADNKNELKHLLFVFWGGQAIRVGADSAALVIT